MFFACTCIDRVAKQDINTFENANKISRAKRTRGSLSNVAVFGRDRKSLDETAFPKNYYKIAQLTTTYRQTAVNYISFNGIFYIFLFLYIVFFIKSFILSQIRNFRISILIYPPTSLFFLSFRTWSDKHFSCRI